MLLQAIDSDSGVNARVMYHVTSSVGAPFSVNAATGQVFTTRQFGSGDPSRFDLTVYADNGRLGMVSNSARLAVTRSCHCHLRKYIIYIAHCSAASINQTMPLLREHTPCPHTKRTRARDCLSLPQVNVIKDEHRMTLMVEGKTPEELYASQEHLIRFAGGNASWFKEHESVTGLSPESRAFSHQLTLTCF